MTDFFDPDWSRVNGTMGDRVRGKKFTIIGVGGIGAWVAIIAAMSGAEQLNLYDNDTIDRSTLTRLPLPPIYLGWPKVTAIAEYISLLRPSAIIVPNQLRVEADTRIMRTDYYISAVDSVPSEEAVRLALQNSRCSMARYVRLSYDGDEANLVRVRRHVMTTGDGEGYVIVPSWAGGAMQAALLFFWYLAGVLPRGQLETTDGFRFSPMRAARPTAITFMSTRQQRLYQTTTTGTTVENAAREAGVTMATARAWLARMRDAGLVYRDGVYWYTNRRVDPPF